MRKQSHYSCHIIPKSCNCNGIIPEERTITIQASNRFVAARAAWLSLGNYFFANIIVHNMHGKVIYKTSFEAQKV
jgi:hypothetical protein